ALGSIGVDRGGGLQGVQLHARDLRRGRHQVVHEGRRLQVAAVVVGEALVEGAAHTVADAAVDEAVHHQRVDHGAAVVYDDVAQEPHLEGLAVHLDDGDVEVEGVGGE